MIWGLTINTVQTILLHHLELLEIFYCRAERTLVQCQEVTCNYHKNPSSELLLCIFYNCNQNELTQKFLVLESKICQLEQFQFNSESLLLHN